MKARTDQLLIEEVGDECIIYALDSKKAHCLNRPLMWIWQHCDGYRNAEQLAADFEQNFSSADPAGDIRSGLRQLASASLLTGEIPPGLLQEPRITRRKVVGVSALAVPLLTTIVAPTPAAAKSKDKDKDKDKDKGKDNGKGGGKGK